MATFLQIERRAKRTRAQCNCILQTNILFAFKESSVMQNYKCVESILPLKRKEQIESDFQTRNSNVFISFD